MAYKIWGGTEGLLNKEDIRIFFEKIGVRDALSILTEAERTRKASVRIGNKKVMLFKV
ncbi:hypothetical protein [Paenibacillus xylaniclasticus]|uniref:hypothetical protein n=1 Tax=Paenibacillus xylaniclasticus TaxID=588083 RepID=UPI0013E0599E|nr:MULTISPECIES: hypothetical protein [Paenibacillus]GFN32536.1 hypothetical protein PCURB6_27960 [Paenibacillus curdlanolyticus]